MPKPRLAATATLWSQSGKTAAMRWQARIVACCGTSFVIITLHYIEIKIAADQMGDWVVDLVVL
jgi:hypothetical protein